MIDIKQFYTGVGSRKTPSPVRLRMQYAAECLERHNFILRSGGADGADLAFESGVSSACNQEIYLPNQNFNANLSDLYLESLNHNEEALTLVEKHHPAPFERLMPNVRRLMTRNCYQVLGRDLKTPSKFLVCWTPNGALVGGTAFAIRIAIAHSVHVYNLGDEGSTKEFDKFLEQYEEGYMRDDE